MSCPAASSLLSLARLLFLALLLHPAACMDADDPTQEELPPDINNGEEDNLEMLDVEDLKPIMDHEDPLPQTRLKVQAQKIKNLISLQNSDDSTDSPSCCRSSLILSCSRAKVDASSFQSKEPLFLPGTKHIFTFTNIIQPNGQHYRTKAGDEATITLNPSTGSMFGTMKTGNRAFSLEHCDAGHVWVEFNVDKFKEGDTEQPEESKDATEDGNPPPATDNTTMTEFSVMIYYTPQFAATTTDIPGFVDQVLAETNQGYMNSKVQMRIKLHCIEAASINDATSSTAQINNFLAMKGGSTAALRNTADTAVLLTAWTFSCGRAHGINKILSGETVSTCAKSCALGYYSFGHELAHSIGAYHNRETGHINPYYSYGQGHLIAQGSATNTNGYRTILSYNAAGHAIRDNYYSNPAVIHPTTGQPTGTPVSNNAAVLTRNRMALQAIGDESGSCDGTTATPTRPQPTEPQPTCRASKTCTAAFPGFGRGFCSKESLIGGECKFKDEQGNLLCPNDSQSNITPARSTLSSLQQSVCTCCKECVDRSCKSKGKGWNCYGKKEASTFPKGSCIFDRSCSFALNSPYSSSCACCKKMEEPTTTTLPTCMDEGCSRAFDGHGTCVDFSTEVDFQHLATEYDLSAGEKKGLCGHMVTQKSDCCHCLKSFRNTSTTTTTSTTTPSTTTTSTTTASQTTTLTTTTSTITTTTSTRISTPCNITDFVVLGGDTEVGATNSVESSTIPMSDLPKARWGHNAFVLPGTKQVVVCGGKGRHHDPAFARTCITMTTSWQSHSSLNQPRIYASSVTMASGDTFILGGWYSPVTSEVLQNGATSWTPGPIPNTPIFGACSVALDSTRFVAIGGGLNHEVVTIYNTVSGTWDNSWPTLTEGRRGHSCVLMLGKIIVAGGYSFNTYDYTATTLHIDATTGSATTGQDMVQARAYFSMQSMVMTGQVLAIGGVIGSGFTTTVEEWNPSSGAWAIDASLALATARSAFATVHMCPKKTIMEAGTTWLVVGRYGTTGGRYPSEVVGNPDCKLTEPMDMRSVEGVTMADGRPLVCGRTINSPYNTVCQVFNTNTGQWIPFAKPLSNSRYRFAPVALPSGTYLLGGSSSSSSVRKTSEFLATGSSNWVAGPSIPGNGAYQSYCAVALNSTAFVIIGSTGHTKHVQVYNVATESWIYWPDLPKPRYHQRCLKYGDKILVTGGYLPKGNSSLERYTKTTLIIDVTTGNNRYAGNLTIPRHYHKMMMYDGKPYVVGGYSSGTGTVKSMEEWDDTTETWSLSSLELKNTNYNFALLNIPNHAPDEFCLTQG